MTCNEQQVMHPGAMPAGGHGAGCISGSSVLYGAPMQYIEYIEYEYSCQSINNNNNRRLVTLAEHTSDHGKQTNSSTKEKGELSECLYIFADQT